MGVILCIPIIAKYISFVVLKIFDTKEMAGIIGVMLLILAICLNIIFSEKSKNIRRKSKNNELKEKISEMAKINSEMSEKLNRIKNARKSANDTKI